MPEPSPSLPDALHIWRFAGVRFDERTLEVEHDDGRVVPLERKPNDVLRHLLRHAGEVVTKNELLDQIWPGRYVTEGVLSKHIARLRRAIGDEQQLILRTVPGLGYRLVAEVSRVPAPRSPEFPALELLAGQRLEQRPNWRLEQRLGRNRSIEVWRLCQVDSGEQRVFKLCSDEADLVSLKREITISRLLREGRSEQETGNVPVIDWNLAHSPYWIELPWLEDGSLIECWQSRSGTWSLAERITLAADIAHALARAHEVGVLHKDLKPANILIDRNEAGKPVPKLADFGSARLLDPERLPELGITRLGFTQPATGWSDTGGTPLYLAPEVIRGGPFTLASDLYAFGIVLYQLVIDDLLQPLAAGWERGIDDELLREDIAILVEGDPTRRVADAGAVAQRLRSLDARRSERDHARRLAAEAEQARVGAERARRRRNLATAFAAILLLALVVTGAMFLRAQAALELARSEAERADRQAAQAAAVSEFLTRDLLAMADPFVSGERDLTVRKAIEFARGTIAQRFAAQPETAAAVRLRIGLSLQRLGELEGARAELAQALTDSQEPELRANVFLAMAALDEIDDRSDSALANANAALELAGDDLALVFRVRSRLAWLNYRNGDYALARVQFESLLAELSTASQDVDDIELVEDVRGSLANVLTELGDNHEAERLWQTIAEARAQRYGAGHPTTLYAQRHHARVLSRLERHDQAITLLRQAHDDALAVLGGEHNDRLHTLNELATALQYGRQLEAALPLFEELVETRLRVNGERHRSTRTAMNNYAMILNLSERPDQAQHWYRRAYDAEVAELGESHPDTLILAHNLARTLRATGEIDQAEAMQVRNLELARELLPPDHWQLAIYMATLAETLELQQRFDEALAQALPAAEIIEQTFGADHARSRHAVQIVERLRQRSAEPP